MDIEFVNEWCFPDMQCLDSSRPKGANKGLAPQCSFPL